MNDLNLSKLSLEDDNKQVLQQSPSHPRQRIQFYQDESQQSQPSITEPQTQLYNYEQPQAHQQQPYNNNNNHNLDNQQQQQDSTSIEFGVDLPNDISGGSGIQSNEESNNWFERILDYQKQHFSGGKEESIDNYIKNHSQYRLNENQEKKKYSHPINTEYGIDQSVLSSSTTIFNKHDQFNKSNLPNGFLLSPFYHPITTPSSYDYKPPQCTNCHSFVNIYCKLNSDQTNKSVPVSWICSICNNENNIDDGSSGVRNILDVVKGYGWWNTNHYKSVFSSESYDIKIKKNKSNGNNDGKSIYTPNIIDSGAGGIYDEEEDIKETSTNNGSTTKIENNNYIFLIDENISTADLKEINESIKLLVNELPNKSNVGVVTFSKNISIFEMNTIENQNATSNNKQGIMQFNSAKLVDGSNSIDQERYLLKRKRKLYLEPVIDKVVAEGNSNEQQSTETRAPKLDLVLTSLLETFENNGESVVYESKPISLGVAIECAISLIPTASVNINSRLFIFLNGSPDYGPGSIPKVKGGLFINTSSIGSGGSGISGNQINEDLENNGVFSLSTEEHAHLNNAYEYYEKLGEKSYCNGISIDIACIGYNNFESKVISRLCRPSGYMTSSLNANANSNDRSAILFKNMYNAIIKNSGVFGQLDIHTHDSINLTHLIGPTIMNPKYKNRKIELLKSTFGYTGINAEDGSGKESENEFISEDKIDTEKYTSFIISNLQQDICFSIYYNLIEDIPLDYIHFQFVIHLFKENGTRISRVITKRYKITGNFDKFFSSLDFRTVSILLSKRIVLSSLKDQKTINGGNIQSELDNQVRKICLSCSKVETNWWFKKSVVVPEIVKHFIKTIYKIKQGLIFGSLIQNDDDLILVQNYLLNCNYVDCQKLLFPKLLLLRNDGGEPTTNEIYNIPLDICAIGSNVILVLDCFTNIYVLVGSEIQNNVDKMDILEQHLKQTTNQRVPSPTIIRFSEKGHEIRWLKSILSSSESFPIQERIEIVKEIYPEFANYNIDSEFLKRFDDPFSNQDVTPAKYERQIITNLLN